MDYRQHSDLIAGLKRHEKAAVAHVLKSEAGQSFYTVCEKLCLKLNRETETLFKAAWQRALTNSKSLGDSIDLWFLKNCHTEWLNLSQKNSLLKESSVQLSFDWSRVDPRQSDDVLIILTPLEREVFIYRFWLKYPAALITSIMAMQALELQTLFHSTMGKIIK